MIEIFFLFWSWRCGCLNKCLSISSCTPAVSPWAAVQRRGRASREQLISASVQKKSCTGTFGVSTGWRPLQWAAWAVHGRGTSVASCIWPLTKENSAFFLIILWEDSPRQLCGGNETSGGGGVKQIHPAAHTAGSISWMPVFGKNFFWKKKNKACQKKRAFQGVFFHYCFCWNKTTTSRCRGAGF